MPTLREQIGKAQERKVALGHFNISDSNQLNAILAAGREAGVPVVIGLSEGERTFFGAHSAVALVREFRAEGAQVYLNADHTYSIEGVKEVIDAGFDSVVFDGSHLPLAENIAITAEAVKYARGSGRDVLIEGEIGRIGMSSKLLDAPPEDMDADLTEPEDAARFVAESGADLLAPAVGTMHGRLKSGVLAKINVERVAALHAAVAVPLVLHGGSGSADEDFVAAIEAGMSMVHINTDIRVAYRKGIEASLSASPDEIAPYKFLAGGTKAVEEMTLRYLKLFNRS